MLHVLLFTVTYVLGFLLTITASPVYAFVLYELMYFFNPLDRWWATYIPDIRYSLFTVVLMMVALFIEKTKFRSKNSLLAVPQFKWIYLLLVLYAIASFYAVNPDEHQEALVDYFKLIIVISIAYKLVDSSQKLDFALWGYIFGSWYISFLIYQTGRGGAGRVEGIGTVDAPDANGIAAAIAPSLVICLYYFWMAKSKSVKLLFAVAGIFAANAIILINSRGAFLAVASSILFLMYYMFFSSLRRKFQTTIAVGIAIAGISGILYLADESFFARVETMSKIEVTKEKQSGSTRFVFWSSAIELAKDRPFGSGYRGFDFYAPLYIPEDVDTGSTRSRSVHSSWFEALTEIGYLGMLALILLIYSSIKSLRTCMAKLKQSGDFDNYFKVITLQAALLSFMVSMTFMNRFRAEILYWLILYSACAYNIYVVKFSDNNAPDNAIK